MKDNTSIEKKRYTKISEEKLDAQAIRLTDSLNLVGLSQMDVMRKCELSGCTIGKGNFSNYCHGQRIIAQNHIDSITNVLMEQFALNGIVRNPILFKDYLLGNLPFIDSYEEYEAYVNDRPEECFSQYNKFFAFAGMILGYDNGIAIWTRKSNIDEKTNKIKDLSNTKIEEGEPEYSLHYNGKTKDFSISEMKNFYNHIIQYIQEAFEDYQDESYNPTNKDEFERFIKWHPDVYSPEEVKAIEENFKYMDSMKEGDSL